MKWHQRLLSRFNGLHFSQEYICFGQELFHQPLFAYLVNQEKVIKDITGLHAFVGYCPLVYAIPSAITREPYIRLAFSAEARQPNDIFKEKDAIALLDLQMINEISMGSSTTVFYEGISGRHQFLSAFHQAVIRVYNHLYNRKPGNVFLHDDLYRQVQIADAIPRNISLITVGQDGLFNCFPTDLHGPFEKDHYMISLRHQGKACRQVIGAGNILLTEMDSRQYKTVYSLGKNHMQDFKSPEHFHFSRSVSLHFGLPVPEKGVRYRELALEDSFNHGIHKIMMFRVVNQESLDQESTTLAHIHAAYATWRQNKALPGNYLLR